MEAPIYFGSDLGSDAYELLACTRIAAPYRELESDVLCKKWFDYMSIHPAQATYLFAHQYQEAARRFFASTRDIRGAQEIKAFQPDDIFQSRELTAMWRARQSFDMIGCRYEWGLNFAFSRAVNRGWHYFPRPNQLYAQDLLLDLKVAWLQNCKDLFQTVQNERFRLENYNGHPDQLAFLKWAAEQVKKRRQPQVLLGRLFKERMMSERVAIAIFGHDLVTQAKRFVV